MSIDEEEPPDSSGDETLIDEENPGFTGKIVVASQIVDALSSGLYDSPAACLKELINNAYDADASTVRVYVRPDAETIVIDDDGHGMDQADFEKNFQRISESHKRAEGAETAKYKRDKIGKIGIGFIAANELCDVMEIDSTKAGSTDRLTVFINFAEMRKPAAERKEPNGDDIRKGDYYGDVVQDAEEDDHYTRITLHSVDPNAQTTWASRERLNSEEERRDTVYGKKPTSIRKLLATDMKSWEELDLYSLTLLEVALNVPVPYLEDWIDPQYADLVKPFEEKAKALNFSVLYDGTELRKPVVLHGGRETICRAIEHKSTAVSYTGYLYAQGGIVKPQEIQGVLIRLRNAAIGGYDRDLLNYPSGENQVLRNWVSAEIWASDELEEAMNIDRRTLRATHPAFVELQKAFHAQLRSFLSDVRRDIYEARRDSKALERVAGEQALIARVVEQREHVPDVVRKSILDHWQDASEDAALRRRLLKTYSVGQLLDLVSRAAEDIVAPDQLPELMREVSRRLRDRS